MKNFLPKRLRKEPLIEAVWQVQFQPSTAGGEILVGVLYQNLRNDYPIFLRLPSADIPAPAVEMNPNLRYLAKFRLENSASPFVIQVGDRVVSLHCRRPYAGWPRFKENILKLAEELKKSSLPFEPERHSLHYFDLLQIEPPPSLASFNLNIQIANRKVIGKPLQMRTEISDGKYGHIVQIMTPVEIAIEQDRKESGALIDLETFAEAKDDFWFTVCRDLDDLHNASKRMFFMLLTPEAITRLEPEYEEPTHA